MALASDDPDIRPAWFSILQGGNGDYYLTTVEKQDVFDPDSSELKQMNVLTSVRVAMSGGNAPHEVRMAVIQLHRALEEAGLNQHALEHVFELEKES